VTILTNSDFSSNIQAVTFKQNSGGIIGMFIDVNADTIFKEITLYIGHSSTNNHFAPANGRNITVGYWIVDETFDKNFNIDDLNIPILDKSENILQPIYCNKINCLSPTDNVDSIIYGNGDKTFINTNNIPLDSMYRFSFSFDLNDVDQEKLLVKNGKIFLAIISNSLSYSTTALTIGMNVGGTYYYTEMQDNSKTHKSNLFSIYYENIVTGKLLDDANVELESSKPPKIRCSDIRYRTLSQIEDNVYSDGSFTPGYDDGGETFEEAYKRYLDNGKNPQYCIFNEDYKFNSDFNISQGNLKDVIFAKPELEAFNRGGEGDLDEARWVFKRSRIKFTIPPVRDKNGNIRKVTMYVRYKVVADIHDTYSINGVKAYRNKYVTKIYSYDETNNGYIDLVICPRDEGVLDNGEFKVVLERAYANIKTYSEPAEYYFKTYQKPIVNIAYPKITRNQYTGKHGFNYCKIPTYNLYANFKGENSICSKHVCDALNLQLASPKPDTSGIPLFVRFYIAEYKYGRNGCLKETKYEDANPDFDLDKFDTLQDLYVSKNKNDYTSEEDILSGNAVPLSYMTGINNCDGNPIVLSGRLTDKNIKDLITDKNGQQLKLWTYRQWDAIPKEQDDILVGNYSSYTNNGNIQIGLKLCVEKINGTYNVYVKLPRWLTITQLINQANTITFKAKIDNKPTSNVAIWLLDPNYKNGNETVYLSYAVTNKDTGLATLPDNKINNKILEVDIASKTFTNETYGTYSDGALELNFSLSSPYNLTNKVVPDHFGPPVVINYDSQDNPTEVKQEMSKALLFRAGYIYLVKARVFHGAAAGAIYEKYGDINPIIYGYGKSNGNSGKYDYSRFTLYGGKYPYNDSSKFGDDKPYYDEDSRLKWHGPEDGTTNVALNESLVNQVYPGFSEADHTFFIPTCSFTSKSNLITMHPTSPQISANQWITFNYRHLAKNIAGIDNNAFIGLTSDSESNKLVYQTKGNCLGNTIGGVQNTMTRILSMYKTCVENMIWKFHTLGAGYPDIPLNVEEYKTRVRTGKFYDTLLTLANSYYNLGYVSHDKECECEPKIMSEKLYIYIDPIYKRDVYEDGINYKNEYLYTESLSKKNIPLVYGCELKNKTYNDIRNDAFYTHINKQGDNESTDRYIIKDDHGNELYKGECGCYALTNYLSHFSNDSYYEINAPHEIKYLENGKNVTHKVVHSPNIWPETNIIYRRYIGNGGTETKRKKLLEPLGNTYRWQVVINASNVSLNNNEYDVKEIKIQHDKDEIPDAYKDNRGNVLKEFMNNDNTTKDILRYFHRPYSGKNTIYNKNEADAEKSFLIGSHEELVYYDNIQNSYFYNEIKDPNFKYDNLISKDSNYFRRFTINEFAGITTGHASYSSGYPAMYTTKCSSNTNYYSHIEYSKYFSNKLIIPKDYGELYTRIPTMLDCENGIISKDQNNIPNSGGIGFTNHNNNIDDVKSNCIPYVRTTHYLYFKTWINTQFKFVIKVNLKTIKAHEYDVSLDEEGNPELILKCFDSIDEHNEENIQDVTYAIHFGSRALRAEFTSGAENLYEIYSNILTKDNIFVEKINESEIYPWDPNMIVNEHGHYVRYGNECGLSEVYGEDNGGWGRCLSADDASSKVLLKNGNISREKTKSGGLEVPIFVRRTPLLQPQLLSDTIYDGQELINIFAGTRTIELVKVRDEYDTQITHCDPNWCFTENDAMSGFHYVAQFALGEGFSDTHLRTVTGYYLNVYYPHLAEYQLYNTVPPNGGNANNVVYENYHIDADTDPSKSISNDLDALDATNLDFLGGSGICTAYTILLIPSDPVLPNSDDEEMQYFTNTFGHWNYYKQPANYYMKPDIFKIRSKSIKDAGPVVITYCSAPSTEKINTTDDGDSLNKLISSYTNPFSKIDKNTRAIDPPPSWNIKDREKVTGHCFKRIPLNFNNLVKGYAEVFNEKNNVISTLNDFFGSQVLTHDNTLKVGLSYDLVIIPIYTNDLINEFDFNGLSGTLNNNILGGTITESYENINKYYFAGSNPYVGFNQLQIAQLTEGIGEITESDDTPEGSFVDYSSITKRPCDDCDITSTDHAIVFPNVDNELYNHSSGEINEGPGFWLDNSFKLILRMPSFRTLKPDSNPAGSVVQTDDGNFDKGTIEHCSNGMLDSYDGDTADDFEFEDIQIHIGKINELEPYGYPNNMKTNLNKITSHDELGKLHIISYSMCKEKGWNVFSKKLDHLDDDNDLDVVTGGYPVPNNKKYKNRFIEVNLLNAKIKNSKGEWVPIYTDYPEGYYIQFRWKNKYVGMNSSMKWSNWHGGSWDGGKKWWGDKGTDYFVPVRNYTDIIIGFRDFIQDSYPGSCNKLYDINGYTTLPNLYGDGNHDASAIIPNSKDYNIKDIRITDSDNKNYKLNKILQDFPYNSQYKVSYNKNVKEIPDNLSNFSNTMWDILYIDYIIRNMSKLYCKLKHNEIHPESEIVKRPYCHLALPYNDDNRAITLNYKCAGWDDMDNKNISQNINVQNKPHPQMWDRNKYYRKVITIDDFKELNTHLIELLEYIRNINFTGKHVFNNKFVLPINPAKFNTFLDRDKNYNLIIGDSIDINQGHSNINNVNYKNITSNYIQDIWDNILSTCS